MTVRRSFLVLDHMTVWVNKYLSITSWAIAQAIVMAFPFSNSVRSTAYEFYKH